MRTVDRVAIRAPFERVFDAAKNVERWPEILPHYRRVRFLDAPGTGGGRLVEMAAWRPFGIVKYPTWWVSEMVVRPAEREIRYRHVRGITRGMDVTWRLAERNGVIDIEVVHEWRGPAWPLVGRLAANVVIGPVFIHGIASRTLAGIKRFVEAQ